MRRWIQWCCAAHVLALWTLVAALVLHHLVSNTSVTQNPSLSRTQCGSSTPHVIFAEKVVLPGRVVSASLLVRDGMIAQVKEGDRAVAIAFARKSQVPLQDFGPLHLSPGLIDVHVHISALGDRGWEGYSSATAAAAAGGITTVIGMPLNSLPPTVTRAALDSEEESTHNM